MELSSPKIKKKLYFTTLTSKFFLEKNLLYFFQKKTALKKFLIFREMELSSPKLIKSPIFFSKKNVLYFRMKLAKPEKPKFLLLREKYL